jgi:hypothetical protein
MKTAANRSASGGTCWPTCEHPLQIRYRLGKELWQRFYDVHYRANRALKIRYLWGVVCIVIGTLGFAGVYRMDIVAGLLMLTGFYAVLSRQLLVIRSLHGAARHPFYGQTLDVSISPAEISVRSGIRATISPGVILSLIEKAPPVTCFTTIERHFSSSHSRP